MSIIQGTAKGGAVATSFYDFPIGDSLRFDGSSYLSRTPTTVGNRKTWTWSGWVKRGAFFTSNAGPVIFSAGSSGSNFFDLRFLSDNSDRLDLFWIVSGTGNVGVLRTNALYRDPSSWYHVVAVLDTGNATSTDTIRLYVNGERITSFIITTYPSPNNTTCYVNATNAHYIGRSAEISYRYFNGYLANIQFIDGQALDQYFFGEFKDNIWVPYNAFSTAGSGTATASDGDTATDSYGTNGFHLDFADSSNIGNDVSGNNNDWTVN